MQRLVLFSLLSISINIAAQPTLTESAYLPVGSQITVSAHSGAISPGGAGANQTWNLSGLTYNTVGQILVVDPNTTPCASLFPTSNYALSIPNGTVHYYERSSTDLQLVGLNWPASCTGGSTYTDYMLDSKFPFSYLDTCSDTYAHNGGSGSVNYFYDGYGTLVTPFGTFTNVGRIKITEGSTTEYAWFYGTTYQHPLARTINNNTATLLYSNFVLSAEEATAEPQMLIYPSPANDILNIQNIPVGSTLCITDIAGKAVYYSGINNETTTINISDLMNGVYIVQLNSNGKITNRKFVVNR